MKKRWIVFTNVVIGVLIVLIVAAHTSRATSRTQQSRIAAFETMTVAMERVAANYLEGEQHICDTWAANINAHSYTIEEAAAFVRSSHIIANRMAHIIYTDDGSLSGLSTVGRVKDPENYQVSYAGFVWPAGE